MLNAAALLVMNCVWGDTFRELLQQAPDLKALVLVVAAFVLTAFTKFSPVYVLLGGAVVGVLLGLL